MPKEQKDFLKEAFYNDFIITDNPGSWTLSKNPLRKSSPYKSPPVSSEISKSQPVTISKIGS